MATLQPTPDFKGKTFELWVLNRADLYFCYCSTPLQDSLAKRREDGGTKIIVNKFYFKPKAKGKYLMYKKGGREGLDFRFREGTLKKKAVVIASALGQQ